MRYSHLSRDHLQEMVNRASLIGTEPHKLPVDCLDGLTNGHCIGLATSLIGQSAFMGYLGRETVQLL